MKSLKELNGVDDLNVVFKYRILGLCLLHQYHWLQLIHLRQWFRTLTLDSVVEHQYCWLHLLHLRMWFCHAKLDSAVQHQYHWLQFLHLCQQFGSIYNLDTFFSNCAISTCISVSILVFLNAFLRLISQLNIFGWVLVCC